MRPFRFPSLLLLLAFHQLPFVLSSQHDLRKDRVFFDKQVGEYQAWLNSSGLGNFFKTENITVTPDKVTLYLASAKKSYSCDSLQSAWEEIRKAFNKTHQYKQLFHEKLLETWSILTELPTDSMEIVLHCQDPSRFSVRIYGDIDGRILAEEQNVETLGSVIVKIPYNQLKSIHTGGRFDSLGKFETVGKVRKAVGDFLLKSWYKGKGTPILYNVRIDTSRTYFHEFTWEFSHLSYEVLEEGFYEYHRIKVEIQDRNNNIEISWQFTGKYGAGVLFPPRKNDYKLMEIKYKEQEMDYETKMFKKALEYLKK